MHLQKKFTKTTLNRFMVPPLCDTPIKCLSVARREVWPDIAVKIPQGRVFAALWWPMTLPPEAHFDTFEELLESAQQHAYN